MSLLRALSSQAIRAAAAKVAINLLFGEHPPSRFGQVARDGHHRLLMILGAFDPLIEAHHVRSSEPALIDYNQMPVSTNARFRFRFTFLQTCPYVCDRRWNARAAASSADPPPRSPS
jgi:hypothetical protein